MKNLFLFFLTVLIVSCAAPATQETGPYSIASSEYSDLTKKANDLLAAMDFDAWGEMLADDVEYYFPDGDSETRTELVGKEAVLNWWKDWKANSGVSSLQFKNSNFISLSAAEEQATTGLAGTYTLSWSDVVMNIENGNAAKFRMNTDVHFNADNKIDRYFTYYDRTGIIRAMGGNVLAEEEAEE